MSILFPSLYRRMPSVTKLAVASIRWVIGYTIVDIGGSSEGNSFVLSPLSLRRTVGGKSIRVGGGGRDQVTKSKLCLLPTTTPSNPTMPTRLSPNFVVLAMI